MSEEQEENQAQPTDVEPIAGVRKEIYIGPSILARGLQQFVVFEEIPDDLVEDAILSRLFVPVEDLSKARAALSVEGSPEWTAYRAAVAAFISNQAR